MQHVVVDPSGNVTAGAENGAADGPAAEVGSRPSARRWTGRLFGSVLLTALVVVSATALAAVTVGATGGSGGSGHGIGTPSTAADTDPVAVAGPRVTAYPGDPERFFVTVDDARACALPAGVTGPTADGRVRFTVTGTSQSGSVTRVEATVDTLRDLKVYYASPDDLVLGFARTAPAGLAEARLLNVGVECRTPDGSWAPVATTGEVAVPAAADRPPASVTDPLTADSQVALDRGRAGSGRLLDATVDGQPARITGAGDGPKVLLPSGTGPGSHLLTLTFEGGSAALGEDGLTLPIVNGYAPPSAGAGALSTTIEIHGGTEQPASLHGAPPFPAGGRQLARFESGSPGDGYGGGAVVLGWLSLLLLGVAGSLIWTFRRLGTAG